MERYEFKDTERVKRIWNCNNYPICQNDIDQSLEATYAYYYAKHKNKSLKELEVELEEIFKKTNLYEMNFANPRTYCQKVYWLRLYGATPLKTNYGCGFNLIIKDKEENCESEY